MQTATYEEIKSGKVTDIYFERTREVLDTLNIHRRVTMAITASSLPDEYAWAVLAGVYDTISLLEGLPVDVETMEEGTFFAQRQPIMQISGDYLDFGVLETAILGYVCQASGIATKAARCKKAAGNRALISFGARRMHPALATFIERNAYIGGCDGVSVILAADQMGMEPSGTMPHALVIILGGITEATKRFDEIVNPNVPRVALTDTFCDEKLESIMAAEAIGDKLYAVRLDTPGSRRGNMAAIIDEVRWELDIRGYNHVKIIVSGGIDEKEILRLNERTDGYGVGTAISNAKTIDFAMDIVEMEGRALAKRGKKAGRKQVLRCEHCCKDRLVPYSYPQSERVCDICGSECRELLVPAITAGKRLMGEKSHSQIRNYVLKQLENAEL